MKVESMIYLLINVKAYINIIIDKNFVSFVQEANEKKYYIH